MIWRERLAEPFDQTRRWGVAPKFEPTRSRTGGDSCCRFGRAIIPRPKTLMMDKPSVGLAKTKVSERFDTLAGVRRRKGFTPLLIRHYATESLSCSERAVVLVQSRRP